MKTTTLLFVLLGINLTSIAQDGVRSEKSTKNSSSKKEVTNTSKIKSSISDSTHAEQKKVNQNTDTRKAVKK